VRGLRLIEENRPGKSSRELRSSTPAVRLELVPVTLTEARRFVGLHHRHNRPPQGWKWGVGLARNTEIVGVGIIGRPISREIQTSEPRTLEITRVCTVGDTNANSRLYGALCRAAEAKGWLSVISYTLESESGASLRAAGFVCEGPAGARAGQTWHGVISLFGDHSTPDEPKNRWRRNLKAQSWSAGRLAA